MVGNTIDRKTCVAEAVSVNRLGGLYGQHTRWGVFDVDGKVPCLTASAGMGGGHIPMFPIFDMAPFQNVYNDLRDKLIARGIPAEEIAFVHSANTEARKKELFEKVRSGQIRVLIGSTQKMGAGTNVQHKLIALHHLDCPWRPSDDGRTLRTHTKAEAPAWVSPLFQGRM